MQLQNKIIIFDQLKSFLKSDEGKTKIEDWKFRIKNENGWFTSENVDLSLNSIVTEYLDNEKLQKWCSKYNFVNSNKKIGLVLSGNLPAVGFFDMMAVILSGNIALIKLSTLDTVLMKGLIATLINIDPKIEAYIEVVDKLNDADAFIATGSDNSARYFEYYFSKKPHIIRKNRTSVAILKGDETEEDFKKLSLDIFSYYGLGCRNVSKIYVPKNFDFIPFFESIEFQNKTLSNHKYQNNYDYNKSILLVNGTHHYDNGFLLVTKSENLVSPISVLFYEEYDDLNLLKQQLNSDKIQCIISKNPENIPFGNSQNPSLNDFPDGIDIMDFLQKI